MVGFGVVLYVFSVVFLILVWLVLVLGGGFRGLGGLGVVFVWFILLGFSKNRPSHLWSPLGFSFSPKAKCSQKNTNFIILCPEETQRRLHVVVHSSQLHDKSKSQSIKTTINRPEECMLTFEISGRWNNLQEHQQNNPLEMENIGLHHRPLHAAVGIILAAGEVDRVLLVKTRSSLAFLGYLSFHLEGSTHKLRKPNFAENPTFQALPNPRLFHKKRYDFSR